SSAPSPTDMCAGQLGTVTPVSLCGAELHPQFPQGAGEVTGRELGLAAGYQPDAGQRVQQLLEQDLQLQPGQVGAQAEMGAVTERRVGVVLPGHVEALRLAELPAVRVAASVHQQYLPTFLHPLTT